MEIADDTDLGRLLLKKLHTVGCGGTRHTSERNLPKVFPPHVRKRVLEIAEKFRTEGLLVKRPSSHEYQWYLNWNRKQEIEERIIGR